MDQLLAMLGLPPGGTTVIRDLRLDAWGRDLTLDCVYRGMDGDETRFRVMLLDCRELTWRIYAVGNTHAETPLVDLTLGRGGHRSPLRLLAGAFGLTAVYGELRVSPEVGGV